MAALTIQAASNLLGLPLQQFGYQASTNSGLCLEATNEAVTIKFGGNHIKNKRIAPTREPNDRYNGGSADSLFGCEKRRVAVPRALKDAGVNGDPGDEKEKHMGNGGSEGGGGGGDRGDRSGHEDLEQALAAKLSPEEIIHAMNDLVMNAPERRQQRLNADILARLEAMEQLSKPKFSTNIELPKVNVIRPYPKSKLRIYVTDNDVCKSFGALHMKRKGNAPSRERNDYNGGALDDIFDAGSGRVGVGRALREASSGGGRDDKKQKDLGSENGGYGGGDGGSNEKGGDEGVGNRRMPFIPLQGAYPQVMRDEQGWPYTVRVQQPSYHVVSSTPQLQRDSPPGYFPHLQYRSPPVKRKGSAPSREANENYHGGASDNLFCAGNGNITVPQGLREAGGGGGGDKNEKNSSNGSGGNGGGDGDGSASILNMMVFKFNLLNEEMMHFIDQIRPENGDYLVDAEYSDFFEEEEMISEKEEGTTETKAAMGELLNTIATQIEHEVQHSQPSACTVAEDAEVKHKGSTPIRQPSEISHYSALDNLFRRRRSFLMSKESQDAGGEGGDDNNSNSGDGSGGGDDDDGNDGDDEGDDRWRGPRKARVKRKKQ